MPSKNQLKDWTDFRTHLDTEMQKRVMFNKIILWGAIALLAIANAFTASVAMVAVSRTESAIRRLEAAENTIADLNSRFIGNNKKKR